MWGLRVLPLLQDARIDDQTMAQCSTCQTQLDADSRRRMGCGYLPPAEGEVYPPLSDKVPGLDVCPGYVCELPDVRDIAECFPHWKAQSLPMFLGERQPTQALLQGLVVLNNGVDALQALRMREAQENARGGR